MDRRRALGLLAGAAGSVLPAASLAAPSINSGRGRFRALSLVSSHTGESLRTVYWADGTYIPEALEEVNWLMRDWRAEKVARIDRATLDAISATHRLLDTSEAFDVYSGYRCAETNRMLRSRSRGVARNSYHVKAMAADLALSSRSVGQIAKAGRAAGAGGVGRYSRSGFVHLDSGPERDWGR